MEFPVDAAIPALRSALAAHACAILVAAPGAGKTTRVPPALIGEAWLAGRRIVMLEPRRLAARAAARRIAQSFDEETGQRAGYTVRFERRVSAETRIEVVTEGILTRRLQTDPELSDTGLLIFDEFHERSLDGDLGLALALDVQRGLRSDLRILVMSATLDTATLSRHLGDVPVIEAEGRMYPVDLRHLDRAGRQTVAQNVCRAVLTALRDTTGGVLAFLPGEGEIRRCAAALEAAGLPARVALRPLYGAMGFAAQDEAIKPAAPGHRKVVLATTIAETSLTIEGIGAVVDCGYKRAPRFDPATGMTSLETVRVSQASAEQRRGRAGRLGPGVCYRLWPENETRALAPHDPPEILIADLAPLALELALWGAADPATLAWLDPPPRVAFAQALDLLRRLEAVDGHGRLTDAGRLMAQLPLHPRLAHMVVRGRSALAADLAAYLSERDGAQRQAGTDIAVRLQELSGGARERVRQSARQIRNLAAIAPDADGPSAGALVAMAYPDRIAQARGGVRRYRLSGGGGAILPEHDPLAVRDWLAVATTDGASGDQMIRLAAALSAEEIETQFAHLVETVETIRWETRAKAVSATRARKLGALVLEEKPIATADPDAIAAAMLEGIKAMGLAALPWSEAASMFRDRVSFLARVMPEAGWPDLSDKALGSDIAGWLGPWLSGVSRAAHLDRLDMVEIMRSLVPGDRLRRMETLAPSRIEVPSGADIRIDYATEGDPVLRVRLQEMFGLARTPVIADGRAKLRIELLSPAGRPVAVTQSLETFWTSGYPSVRAELRGRYPKHAWPEDPLSAPPVKPRRLR